MKLTKKLAASTAAALALMLAGSGIATADGGTAPTGTGWDSLPNQVSGGGSDTTYPVLQALTDIYNRAPGCNVDTGKTSPTKGTCLASQPSDVATNGNYDHDVVTQNYPAGSSAGVYAIAASTCGTTATPLPVGYNPPIQFARSSRAPAACPSSTSTTPLSETDKDGGGLTFWGFATDGLVGLTYNGRQIPAITLQQMHDIYTCTITNWGAITGNPTDNTAVIVPFGMNKASGTYATFNTLIQAATGDSGFDVDGTAGTSCVHKITSLGGVHDYPFENDAKPILDPAQNGGVTTSNIFWFGSFGEWASFPYKRQSGKETPISTCAPLSSTCTSSRPIYLPNVSDLSSASPQYPLTRVLYHVTKKTDADWNAGATAVQPNTGIAHTGGDVFASASSGASGAVRQFTNYLCTTSTQANDSYFGTDLATLQVNTINQNFNFGFVGNPTAGSFCLIQR